MNRSLRSSPAGSVIYILGVFRATLTMIPLNFQNSPVAFLSVLRFDDSKHQVSVSKQANYITNSTVYLPLQQDSIPHIIIDFNHT